MQSLYSNQNDNTGSVKTVPRFSVVIPLYNKGPYISRAVSSVLNQTFINYEVIIINDGSEDNGPAIIENFSDKRIKLISQPNRGECAARNRGIQESKGEFIALLDADDEWHTNYLDEIENLIKKFPNAGVYGTGYEIIFPDKTSWGVTYEKEKGPRELNDFFYDLTKFRICIFNQSSMAAPRKILLDLGGYPEGVKWGGDGALICKIALHYPVIYSPKVCSKYHQYTQNISSSNREYVIHPFLAYMENGTEKIISEYSYAQNLSNYCNFCRVVTIQRNIFSGHGKIARKELTKISSEFENVKRQLLLLSYIPPFVFDIYHRMVPSMSIIKHKITTKRKYNR